VGGTVNTYTGKDIIELTALALRAIGVVPPVRRFSLPLWGRAAVRPDSPPPRPAPRGFPFADATRFALSRPWPSRVSDPGETAPCCARRDIRNRARSARSSAPAVAHPFERPPCLARQGSSAASGLTTSLLRVGRPPNWATRRPTVRFPPRRFSRRARARSRRTELVWGTTSRRS
jgi:hypothetical protein